MFHLVGAASESGDISPVVVRKLGHVYPSGRVFFFFEHVVVVFVRLCLLVLDLHQMMANRDGSFALYIIFNGT